MLRAEDNKFLTESGAGTGMGELLRRLHEHLAAGRDVFAYFKHEETPQGALYAVDVLKRAASG